MGYKPLSEHFDESEFACHCCGSLGKGIDPELIEKLEVLRHELGDHPVKVLSGFRCLDHNKRVGGASRSQHLLGKAADIAIQGVKPHVVARKARGVGFRGVGLYDTFTHVDTRPNPSVWDNRTQKGDGRSATEVG